MNALDPNADTLNFKETVKSYTKHWKWFLFSVFAAIALAFLYIRYTTPQYAAEVKIQILQDANSRSELNMFAELSVYGRTQNQVEDELQIINSRSNFIDVVKDLGLNTKVIELGSIRSSELYINPPVKLNFIGEDSTINKANYEFYLTLSSNTTFGISEDEGSDLKVHAFGNPVPTPIGDIVLTPNLLSFDRYKNRQLKVVVSPVDQVAQGYREKIMVTNPGEFSNIVNISLEDPIKEKARDVLDALIRVYNRNAIEDKQIIADRTANFINERIADISSSLSSVDQSAEDFKTDAGVTDIASEANINLNVGVANQQELANYRTQLNIAASMQDIVEQQDGFEVLPANIGLSDPTIASTTARYNELVLERNRLLKSSNEKNPVIVNLDQQLRSLKQSMQSSLNSTVNNLGMQVNTLSGQQAIFNSKIYSAPKKERALRDITRRQQTTESLYLYLLQKREEAQIAVASTSAKSKLIDQAYIVSPFPVSPKPSLVYIASFLLGLMVPFSIVYVKDMMDNKIHNMHSLEKLSMDIPILGELPQIPAKTDKFVIKDDRSVLAESLRIIRTNLDYLIRTKSADNHKNNVIFVTSSVPGEGKTFLSTNLSLILASSNKKVLLVGADIRNPKLYSFFSGKNVDKISRANRNKDAGMTEFLYDPHMEYEDIINPMLVHHHTIDVIYSGRIPPNPAELLMSKKLSGFFREISAQYDYVIVDTAPLLVVTDTLLISEYANHMVYVTRAGFTETKALQYPIKLQKEGKIKGLAFVVNDVKSAELGYGGKYGYGYGKAEKKWWKF